MADYCFPPLKIPNRSWPRDAELPDAATRAEEQNYRAIEQWVARLACVPASPFPKGWCDRDTATLSPGDALNVDVTIDTDQSQVMVVATCLVENTSGSANTVHLTGWFRSDGSTLNDHEAAADRGFDWPTGADRTITAACLVDAGASVGFRLASSGSTTGNVDVAISVDVWEVDGQSASCCIQGG